MQPYRSSVLDDDDDDDDDDDRALVGPRDSTKQFADWTRVMNVSINFIAVLNFSQKT